ncbi:MAG: diguanylate cyclase [Methylobacter sp.]
MTNLIPSPMILIVDDVPTNVQILAESLNSQYQIKVATNGIDALDIAQREQPDLILLDVMMPEVDGYEVCRRLKDSSRTQKIAVIFVTAKNTVDDEELGLNLGAVDYITKPFVIPIAKARIRNHIRIKRQADLLESLSLLDGLTHISNRRRFNESLVVEWKRSIRDKTPLSLIIIGIDHFKRYNAHYGYGAGDICLQRITRELSQYLVRPGDLLTRYSGGEFAVILPDTPEKGALHVAERLRARIEKIGLPHAASETSAVVTVSIGVATQVKIPQYFLPQMLNDAADNALKMAKKMGRNRVFSH